MIGKSRIFYQEKLLGIPWLADVRLCFERRKEEQGFRDLRDRCVVLFGDVAPVRRDDDSFINDSWCWATSTARRKGYLFDQELRLGFAPARRPVELDNMVIILRHRSMLTDLGIKEKKEWYL
jgi:hypothetical protein